MYAMLCLCLCCCVCVAVLCSTYGWERYSHFHIGMTGFGASAPYEALYKHFGFEPDQVVTHVNRFVKLLAEVDKRAPMLPILYANVNDLQHDAQTHA